MRVNGKATFYLYDKESKAYSRTVLSVWWEETKSISFFDKGVNPEDKVFVMVPLEGQDVPELKADTKSRVIHGVIEQEITEEYTMSDLVKNYDSFTITSANPLTNGSKRMWHWEVGAK